MKRSMLVIGLVLGVVVSVFAAENAVQLTVQELRIGQSAVKISGDSGQMLEKLYSGTYSVGTNAPNNTLIQSNLTLNGSASVAQTLVVSGAVVNASTVKNVGALTQTGNANLGGTLVVSGAVTHVSTLLQTGAATFTAMPRFNATLATPAAVTVTITNAPASTATVAKWVQFISPDGTTNVFPAWQVP